MKVIFPHVAGSDVSGVVKAVGSDVSGTGFGSARVEVGDEVVVHPGLSCRTCEMCTSGQEFFCRQFLIWGFQTGPNDGGHSEYVTMPAANVLPKPANLTHEEAASMPLVLETAWRMLVTRAKVQAGENVLIWGGVGGLGVMAMQICRLFGANPIPVVGGPEKVAKAEELGAVNVIDRKSQDVAAEVKAITNKVGVDVVFEHSGEETWPTSVAALRWGGRVVVCGASTGFNAVTDLRFLWNKQQNLLGSHLSNKAELSAALKAVEAGAIKPVIDTVLPLSDVASGQQLMEDLKVQGKIVYVP
jgi:alcohol dehydrogenase